MKKSPTLDKALTEIIKYVENTFDYLKNTPATPDDKEIPEEVKGLEDKINKKFASLSPIEHAHLMFFVIMVITKLARLEAWDKEVYDNSVLMAQTFLVALNKDSAPMGVNVIDIAFELERYPTYKLSVEDKNKLMDSFRLKNLQEMEPQGNA